MAAKTAIGAVSPDFPGALLAPRGRVAALLSTLAMFVGGWLGWAAGDLVGTGTAVVGSIVGSGLGWWAARRITAGLLD